MYVLKIDKKYRKTYSKLIYRLKISYVHIYIAISTFLNQKEILYFE